MAPRSTPKALAESGNRTNRRAVGRGAKGRARRWPWVISLALLALAALIAGPWVFRLERAETSNADIVWQRAEDDFKAGRYSLVESALDRLNRLREPTPLDVFLRAQLAMVHDQNDQALAYLARVPDEHYMAAQARLLAGQTELRRNRVRLAEALFRAAIRIDPRLIQAHRELIYIYGMQLRRRELNGEFTALANLTELTFDNVFHWCLLRNNSWEPSEAVASLMGYVAADPADRWSRLALAENYLKMDRLDEAESTIAALPTEDAEALELKARIALERQDLEAADRLLALGRADDPLLARLRGRLALSRGDVKTALANFRISHATDPDNREALYGLAATLELSGDKPAARAVRATAGNLDRLSSLTQRAAAPGARANAGLMRELGEACAVMNRKGEARAWYKLAITLNPLDAESQRALFRLSDAGPHDAEPAATQPTR